MYIRLARSIALLMAVILVLSACAAPAAAPAGEGGEVEKAQISIWADAEASADCWVEVAVEGFNEQSDTVVVEAERKANYIDAVRPALAAGAGPDIVSTHGPAFVAEFALAGQVLPLDDFVEDYGWDDVFVPWALDLGRVEGKLYSLPQELETIVLWYNQTVFEENGWEPPTTIEELQALAAEIQAAGLIPFGGQAGACQACNEWYFTEYVNKIAGPDKVYQALKGEIPWTDEDFVTAIAVLQEMMQAGYWMGSVENFLATDWATYRSAFSEGEAAMIMEGTWLFDNISNELFTEDATHGNDWNWAPFPSATGDAIYNIGIGGTQSINAASENPEAAAEFLTYYFSPDVQAKLFTQCQYGTAPIRIEADAFEGTDPRMTDILAEFAAASDDDRYGYTTWTFWPPKTDQFIYEELEKVWVGDMTPEEYMAGIDEAFQEELAAGETLEVPDR